MDDTSPKLTVIATRMPYIDRRALSEAWFSALHLASDGRVAAGARDRRTGIALEKTSGRPASLRAGVAATSARGERATHATARAESRASAEVTARRTHDARLAANARATYARARSYPPFRTSLTLDARGERVQLLLRRDGATLHVVALCRPAIAETVRRALACADLHVRLGGDAIRSSVEIVRPSGAKG